MRNIFKLSAIVACMHVSNALADIVITDISGTKSIITDNQSVMVDESQNMYTVINNNDDQFSVVDTKNKVYMKTSGDEVCNQLDQVMKPMNDMLNAAQGMMDGKLSGLFGNDKKEPPEINVVKLGDGGKVAGYNTTKYKVVVDGDVKEVFWLTKNKKLLAATQKASESFKKDTLKECGFMNNEDSYEHDKTYLKTIDSGFMLKQLQNDAISADGTPTGDTEGMMKVTSIENKTVNMDKYKIPSSYHKISTLEFMQLQMSNASDSE